MDYPLFFYILLFVVAWMYAAVGHGGASGYLALMGLWGISQSSARPTALILNAIVSIIAFIPFYRKGYFNTKLFLSLAAGSIPMAYLGGRITLQDHAYKLLLGIILLITALRFFIPLKQSNTVPKTPNQILPLLIGAAIGLLSGMIGIGGGIILSPLLILLNWSDMKTTAGISALFIFVNSLAGLLALKANVLSFGNSTLLMTSIAVAGGLTGAILGAAYLNSKILLRVLACVLVIASFKLILL